MAKQKRRFKGGEIGDFTRLREFPMPDLHIICQESEARNLYIKNMKIAAENMRFLLGEEWAFSMDITPELLEGLTGPMKYAIIACVLVVCIVMIALGAFMLSPAGQNASRTMANAGAKKLGGPF